MSNSYRGSEARSTTARSGWGGLLAEPTLDRAVLLSASCHAEAIAAEKATSRSRMQSCLARPWLSLSDSSSMVLSQETG